MPSKIHHNFSLSHPNATRLLCLIYSTLTINQTVISCSSSTSSASRVQHHSSPSTGELLKNQTNSDEFVTFDVHQQLGQTTRPSRNKCLKSNADRDLDKCSAQLIGLGSAQQSYPETMNELNSVFCPKFRETVSCIKNTTECYKPFERQVINWIISSTKRMNYKRCRNENEKQKFLRLTNSCLINMKNPMDDCMGNYIGSLDAIASFGERVERLSQDDILIQLSCCANRRYKQCIMNSAKQRCRHQDSFRMLRRTNSISSQRVARKHLQRLLADSLEDLKTTLDDMALTGPVFVCNNVNEKFCKVNFDGKYSDRAPKHKSIVPAIMKIYSS